MNKTYIKSIFQDMKKTKGKIFSIMVMVALATMVIVGLLLSGVSMRKSLSNSLNRYKHPDIIVRSTYRLDFEDKSLLTSEKNIDKINFIKATDLKDGEKIIRVKEYDSSIPKSILADGKVPDKNDEIILDENLKDYYKLGDNITFSYINSDQKKDYEMDRLTYKVCGFYKSSDHFMENMKEVSPLGKSELTGYAYVLKDNFLYDKYHEANIFYKDLSGLEHTSDDYKKKVEEKRDHLEERIKNRPEEVLNKIKKDANKEIRDAENDLDKADKKISDNEKKLSDAEVLLNDGFIEYQNSKDEYETKINDAKAKLDNSRKTLDDGWAKLEEGKKAYNDNKKAFDEKISQAEYDLADKESDINLGFAKLDGPSQEISDAYSELNKTYENSLAKLDEAKASLAMEENLLAEKKSELEALKLEEATEENLIKIQTLEIEIPQIEEALNKAKSEYETNKNLLDEKYSAEKFKLDQALGELRAKEDELTKAKNLLEEGKEELNRQKESGSKELSDAKNDLTANEEKLKNGEIEYQNGISEFNNKKQDGKNQLEEAYSNLLEKQNELDENKEKFKTEKSKAEKDIKNARSDIKDSKEALLSLIDPEYTVESIFDNQGINTYYQNSLNMDKLSKVFPAFFYLVAMLVTLTTMKRYIEEQRTINGTLKSLGYSNNDIAKRFYIYGITPTIIGAIFGAILGRLIILNVIFTAYSTGFKVVDMNVAKSISVILISILVSTVLIALTVRISSKETVREVPANLLRRKAPDSGTKILLEKIRPLWTKLSFMQKITARNIFRYKSRMLMTIFGVGGCTALLFFGFAMIDAIKDTSTIQQNEILHYQAVVMINTSSKKEDIDSVNEDISNYQNLKVYNDRAKLKNDGNSEELSLIVPEDDKKVKDFISLKNLKRNNIDLSDKKVVLTENISKKLGLTVGDTIRVDIDGNSLNLKIGDISENYISDYLYISKDYLEQEINELPAYNSYLIKGNPTEIKEKLDGSKAINAVVNKTGAYESMDALLFNLNLVITVITVISSALAIVVLYNITSINVGERKRELATVKVLGFYPMEVTSYIYREIFILTILGIFVGFLLGYAMFRYIIDIVAPAEIMIAYRTHLKSYIIAGIITLLISLAILIFVHRDLKKIDMAEAMSSGE